MPKWSIRDWDVLEISNGVGCGFIYGYARGDGRSRRWGGDIRF